MRTSLKLRAKSFALRSSFLGIHKYNERNVVSIENMISSGLLFLISEEATPSFMMLRKLASYSLRS